VLGDHIHQAGSLVTPDRLRFDFTHFQATTKEELAQIEQIVNEKVWESIPVVIEKMNIDEAKELGAMALFGEKYGDVVRVVQLNDYSIELCGGCHVENSAEIGLFKIVSESGIGAGVRRIEAVTSKQAFEFMQNKGKRLEKSASLLKTNEELQAKMSNQETEVLLQKFEYVNDVPVLAEKVSVKDMNQLRTMMDYLKQKIDSGVILLVAENKDKVQLIAGVTEDLIKRDLHAGNLIKEAAKITGGGGGGRPDMAQAGGKDASKIADVLTFVKDYVKEHALA